MRSSRWHFLPLLLLGSVVFWLVVGYLLTR